MNYCEEVAKMLGVELGEWFEVYNYERSFPNKFCLTKEGLQDEKGLHYSRTTLSRIICGEYKIQKLPWKPKNGENYWTVHYNVDNGIYTNCEIWDGSSDDYKNYELGLVFKTSKEAYEIGRDKLVAIIKK